MKEEFHQSKKLSKETMRSLMQRRDHPALLRFLVMLVLFTASGGAVVYTWSGPWWSIAVAQVAFGIMCCSTFACLHETAHNTAFQSKKLNQLAAFIAGIAHLYPATTFKELHFTHHRYTHIPGKDPEISLGNKPAPSVIGNLPTYMGWLTGFPLLLFKVGMVVMGAVGMPESIRQKLYPFVRPKVRGKLMVDSAAVLLMHVGIAVLALKVNPGFWGLFVGQVVGHCFLAGYLVPEHNGLPHKGNIFERTRSIKTNKFVKLLMWNMPYHAEHHAYPAVPFHALPALHEELKDEIIYKEEGHSEFHRNVLQKVGK